MAQGKSVHIRGLDYFRYTLDTKGVKDLADFDKQVQAVAQAVPVAMRKARIR